MKKWSRLAILAGIFTLSFLTLPANGYYYAYDCRGVSEAFLASGGECGGGYVHDFSDLSPLGGLRWLMSSDKAGYFIFSEDYTNYSAVIPMLGALAITVAAALWLIHPWSKASAKR